MCAHKPALLPGVPVSKSPPGLPPPPLRADSPHRPSHAYRCNPASDSPLGLKGDIIFFSEKQASVRLRGHVASWKLLSVEPSQDLQELEPSFLQGEGNLYAPKDRRVRLSHLKQQGKTVEATLVETLQFTPAHQRTHPGSGQDLGNPPLTS